MNIRDKADRLKRFADIEGSGIGDMWNSLVGCSYKAEYYSDEFSKALEKEIDKQIEFCLNNAIVIEEEQTISQKVTRIEWNDLPHLWP